MENRSEEGLNYLYRRGKNLLIAMGTYSGGKYHNYGIVPSDYGISYDVFHTYRLTNRIAADGSNMVYLYVDGAELGALNNYYVNTTNQNTTSNWISGKDFYFPYLGAAGFSIGNCSLEYIQVWEKGVGQNNYRWETQNDTLSDITDSFIENTAALQSGSVADGVYTGAYYKVDKTINLLHDRPWSVEWQSDGAWNSGSMLFSHAEKAAVEGNTFFFRRKGSTLMALGTYTDGAYHNYGITLSDHGIDGTIPHVYRIANRVYPDGSNMVYLYVDGVEIGAMNGYYLGGTSQDTTSDWLSGQDFTFNYIGNADRMLSDCSIGYIEIWEDGTRRGNYRWETQNDVFTDVTTNGNAENEAVMLSGSITDGTFSGTSFKPDTPIVLQHDQSWVLQWKSEGNWKDTQNGAMLLSSEADSTVAGMSYLYRRGSSGIIAFGQYSGSKHLNYGIRLSDYGIDGTKEHIYTLINRVHSDAYNMVYLFVDGVEIGPMNNLLRQCNGPVHQIRLDIRQRFRIPLSG